VLIAVSQFLIKLADGQSHVVNLSLHVVSAWSSCCCFIKTNHDMELLILALTLMLCMLLCRADMIKKAREAEEKKIADFLATQKHLSQKHRQPHRAH